MLKKWDITIPQLTGAETRSAYLYLPESYEYERDRRYPVLYMFDGHNVFLDSDATYGKSWGMKAFMEESEMQLIIVAVECNHSPDHGRLKEYSPFDFSDPSFGQIEGRGRITMEWMIHTLKPEIDRNYRTLRGREYTFIGGSSMGGLMSLYGVLTYNKVFSGAIALSPSLWTNGKQINMMIKDAKIRPGTVVYLDYGSKELASHPGMEKKLKKTIGMLMDKRIWVTARLVPDGTHSEASWEKQLPFAMGTLMYRLQQ